MGWKSREKQLSREEAIEQARRDLAPYWLGSSPLLAAIRAHDGRATVFPIDSAFDKRAWILLFADLTTYAGEAAILHAREWHRRYATHGVGVMLVVRATYSFLSTAQSLYPVLGKSAESFVIVLDHEGLLEESFGVTGKPLPSVRLLYRGKLAFEGLAQDWAMKSELELQRLLRSTDTGLPLAPPFDPSGSLPVDAGGAELGARARAEIFKIAGKFAREGERVLVKDPALTIQFASPTPRVSIVAQSVLAGHPVSRLRIELNGAPVFEAGMGADLMFGESGGCEVRVTEGRLYRALQSLKPGASNLALRFPDAATHPISVFGVRFAR